MPAARATYTYDAEGRLVTITTSTDTWSFEYDALGNRVASTHNGVRTEYLVDASGAGGGRVRCKRSSRRSITRRGTA